MTTEESLPRLIPTGTCWCGCGAEVTIGKFFAPGHDKQAEALLLAVEFGGSVPQMLHRYGFGPQRSLQDHALATQKAERCGAPGCDYVARPRAVANHRKNRGH
jgi:hypothetical protein